MDDGAATNGIPTIRISTESERNMKPAPVEEPEANGAASTNGESVKEAPSISLEKPVHAAAGEGSQDGSSEITTNTAQQEAFSFSNKRLCERWLDNLFMVLYEVCGSSS